MGQEKSEPPTLLIRIEGKSVQVNRFAVKSKESNGIISYEKGKKEGEKREQECEKKGRDRSSSL